jgi:proton glutamate symport protein
MGKYRLTLHLQIFISILLGILYGLFLADYIDFVSWMGDLFVRGLKMVVIPLIITSVISGISNNYSSENIKRIGIKIILYYTFTAFMAIATGLILVNIFKPGVGIDFSSSQNIENYTYTRESFLTAILKIVPTNLFQSIVNGDILPVVIFSMLFGFFITKVNEKSKTFMDDLFSSSTDVMIKIVDFIIKFAPLGTLGIIAKIIASETSDGIKLLDSVKKIEWFIITVLLGLLIHGALTLPLLLKIIGKINPWLHFKAMRSALYVAFSTSSSSTTLPVTLQNIQTEAGVSQKISCFTLPIGAVINRDAIALYQCIAALFIAQSYGIELNIYEQGMIVVTSILASFGTSSVPMGSFIIISTILTSMGIPLEGLGVIFVFDRFFDMFRVFINVWSDSCATAIIAKTEDETLFV